MNTSKFVSKLITLAVALQLMVGSIPYTPVQTEAWAESCTSGLVFNSILGRCLSSEQASQVAQAAQVCESKATDAEKKQCYFDAAEGRLKDAVAKGDVSEAGKVKGDAIGTILTMGGLVASVGFLATNKGDCKGATSAYLIAGGSVAVVAGEILAKRTYKKKMKAAEEKLKKINDSSEGTTSSSGTTSGVVNATNVQVEAFEALIMQEDAVISASKTKKKLYMLATATYAAAAVMAGLEWMKGPAAICTKSAAKAEKMADAEKMPEGVQELVDNKPKLDSAGKPIDTRTSAINAANVMPVASGLAKLFAAPPTRTALAGILTANNVRMIAKIGKEEKKAKERKKFLEELRDQVMAAGTSFSCTSADRSNPGNINCYCYGTDGKVNPARSNSQVCKALLQNSTLAATTYSTSSGEAIPTFCTTSSGALDETCNCKATNTCFNLGGLNGNLGASGINLGSIPSTLNSVNGGTLSGGNLDESSLTAQAARLSNIADAIEKKNPRIADANKKAELAADRMVASAASQLGSSGGLGSGASNEVGDSLMAAQTPAAALEAIKQEIGRVENNAAGAVGTRSAESELDFSGLGGSGPAGGVKVDDQLAAAMENQLSQGNIDISSSNGNIFQILSNRYQQSGMRRLFGGEQLMQADTPNETDINK